MVNIWIGWDPQEMTAHVVAAESFRRHTAQKLNIQRICLQGLPDLYTRETTERDGQLWDVLSNAAMTTQHAIARFFVPFLQDYRGWALFTDGDVLCRADLAELFACADDRYAVQVVQHPPLVHTGTKKDGAPQAPYPRKNWSSVVLFNCGHPAHRQLTLDVLNTWPGRDLHAFKWLKDEEIGPLPAGWNYLVGVTNPMPNNVQLAHYTLGTPDRPGHESDAFADEWFATAEQAGCRLPRRHAAGRSA
jgi:hypothetical protein